MFRVLTLRGPKNNVVRVLPYKLTRSGMREAGEDARRCNAVLVLELHVQGDDGWWGSECAETPGIDAG